MFKEYKRSRNISLWHHSHMTKSCLYCRQTNGRMQWYLLQLTVRSNVHHHKERNMTNHRKVLKSWRAKCFNKVTATGLIMLKQNCLCHCFLLLWWLQIYSYGLIFPNHVVLTGFSKQKSVIDLKMYWGRVGVCQTVSLPSHATVWRYFFQIKICCVLR